MDKQALILYLCNGEKPECSKRYGCSYGNYEWGCRRTADIAYAKHGVCDGNPKWYPERFYELAHDGSGVFVEKK